MGPVNTQERVENLTREVQNQRGQVLDLSRQLLSQADENQRLIISSQNEIKSAKTKAKEDFELLKKASSAKIEEMAQLLQD